MAFQHHAVHRHFFAGLHQDGFSHSHFLGFNCFPLAVPLHAGAVRTDVHQMGNALAAAPFGHFLKEFSHLEKQHDKHCLRELGFRTRHKADAQGAQGGNAHKEVLAQGLSVEQPFGRFLQRVPTYNQVGHQEQQQILPGGPVRLFLYDDRRYQKDGGGYDLEQPALALFLLFVVVMVMFVFVVVFVMMLVVVLMPVAFALVLVFVFMLVMFHSL